MALYDPNEIPTETVTPDFTLADVLAWARTKPADETYEFFDACGCAMGQFLLAAGIARRPHVDLNRWQEGSGEDAQQHHFDERAHKAAHNNFERSGWTFGAFADRLEKALSK